MAATLIANIIDPEVLGDQIAAKYPDMLVLGKTELVRVNGEFPLGAPGTVFKIPFWNRITGFSDMTEVGSLSTNNITASSETATVVRGGAAWEVKDTATLVSMSDPVNEISNQIARRAAEYIDGKLVAQCDLSPHLFDQNSTAVQTNANGTLDQNAIIKAMTSKLGDNHTKLLQGGWIIMHSKVYGDLLQTGAVQNQYQIGLTGPSNVIQGASLAMIAGLKIWVSDRVTSNTVSSIQQYKTYLVAPESLALFYQREVQVEFDRDILAKSDIISADVHFAPHLYGYDDVTASVVAQDDKSVHVVRINTR